MAIISKKWRQDTLLSAFEKFQKKMQALHPSFSIQIPDRLPSIYLKP